MNAAKQKSPKRKQEKVRLNARNAHAQELERGEKEKFFWDDELKGFGLRLRREGEDSRTHRCWVVGYQLKGRYQRFTLADYEKLTAEQARVEARKLFGKVARGEDPMAERRQANRLGDALTLRSVVDDYLAKKADKLRPASLRAARLYLTGGYFRPLHPVGISAITRADIASRLNKIDQESGSITARAARGVLSTLYSWAMTQGLTEINPVVGTDRFGKDKPRERVLDDGELAAIWHAAGNDDDYGKIIRLLMLIPCRRDEIGGLQWNEIGEDKDGNAIVTLPEGRVKNKRPFTLPLLPQAQEILDSVEPHAGRDSLFGDRSSAGFTAWSAAKAALDKRLKGKVMVPWRLHDLRRSVSTKMHDLGVEPHYVEAVLNHYSGHRAGVAGRYNYAKYPTQIRAALALWSDHLRSLTEGGERKVVKLPPRKPANFPQRGG
jgi:integrase